MDTSLLLDMIILLLYSSQHNNIIMDSKYKN